MRKTGLPTKRKARSRFTDEYGVLLEQLVAARKRAGVSQKRVAEHLGKEQSHVSKCEHREREISIIDLMKWCEAIGISMSEFIKDFETTVKKLPRR